MICLLSLCCLFSFRPSVAWWSLVYPRSVYEAGVEEKEKHDGQQVQIRWKLAEWISGWFS